LRERTLWIVEKKLTKILVITYQQQPEIYPHKNNKFFNLEYFFIKKHKN